MLAAALLVVVASCESPDTEYESVRPLHHSCFVSSTTTEPQYGTNFHPHTPWYWGGCSSLQNRFAVCHSAHKSQTRGRRDDSSMSSSVVDGVVSTQAIDEVLTSPALSTPSLPGSLGDRHSCPTHTVTRRREACRADTRTTDAARTLPNGKPSQHRSHILRIAAKSENSLLQVDTLEFNLSNSCVFLGLRTRGRESVYSSIER